MAGPYHRGMHEDAERRLEAGRTGGGAGVVLSGRARVRVRYSECDPMGVVHHAAYIPWLELGRTELLRQTGVSYAELEKQGVLLVVVRLSCRYKRPARYDDEIEVRTSVVGGGRVKIEHEYELVRDPDGAAEVVLTGETTLGCVDREGRPRELPSWLVVPR